MVCYLAQKSAFNIHTKWGMRFIPIYEVSKTLFSLNFSSHSLSIIASDFELYTTSYVHSHYLTIFTDKYEICRAKYATIASAIYVQTTLVDKDFKSIRVRNTDKFENRFFVQALFKRHKNYGEIARLNILSQI